MTVDIPGIKILQRQMWSAGDYPDIAQTIEPVAAALVARAGIAEGQEVLDIATGSGNVAIAAARTGARVTGLDLTPELLDAARRRAAQAGVEIEWIEGDAEELPFADDSFDAALSVFGTMFAPRHKVAAGELVRVARPGGTIGFCAWTPEGMNGKIFETVSSHFPPLPPELKSPTLLGTEEYVRELFTELPVELEFERHMVTFTHESPEAWVSYNEQVLGPTIMAKRALEPEGRWEDLRAELVELYEAENMAADDTLKVEAEYLMTLGQVLGG